MKDATAVRTLSVAKFLRRNGDPYWPQFETYPRLDDVRSRCKSGWREGHRTGTGKKHNLLAQLDAINRAGGEHRTGQVAYPPTSCAQGRST